MKRFYLGLIIVCLLSGKVQAEELTWGSCTTYAPMPVLFIHGINSNCKTWDTAIPKLKEFFNYRDVKFNKGEEKIVPLDILKQGGDAVTWFKDKDGNYESPAKLYLETFDYGGEDREGSFKSTSSHQQKLKDDIKKILTSYYGENYNPETAKLIIVGYSQGGLIAREYVQSEAEQAKNVKRLITIGTPHYGSDGLAGLLADFTKKASPSSGVKLNEKGRIVAIMNGDVRRAIEAIERGDMGIWDLLPNSSYLNKLNQLPMPGDIEYVCLAGRKGKKKDGDGRVSILSQQAVNPTTRKSKIPWNHIIELINIKHEQEPKEWRFILGTLDGIPDKANKHYDTPRIAVRFTNKPPDSNFKLGSASISYKGDKGSFYVVGEVSDYLPGSSTISIELKDKKEKVTYAKDDDNRNIKDMYLKPLRVRAGVDISRILYNSYFAYKLNLNDIGTGTHHLRVSVTNPAGLTATATTISNGEWIPFTVTKTRVNARVAMAASPEVDIIPQGIVAKSDCYYFDNQGHEWEKDINTNLRVDSDSIVRYDYAGNIDNPDYRHRILLESTVYSLASSNIPIASVVDSTTALAKVYSYASYPFSLILSQDRDGEDVYMADVNWDGTITDTDVVTIRNNDRVAVPQVKLESSGNITYTNPVGGLYILKDIQRAYDYAVGLEGTSSFNPVVNIAWAQWQNYTKEGVSCYGTASGRIEMNGASQDEFKPDRICQAYGNYLMSHHCRQRVTPRPLRPEGKGQDAGQALMNGLCMRYSAAVREESGVLLPGMENKVDLSQSTHKGIDSSIAVAQALFRLKMKDIWQALYHPQGTAIPGGWTVLDLLDEIDLQKGSGSTQAIRDEFFPGATEASGTSGATFGGGLSPGSSGTVCSIRISPERLTMPVGGTVTFTVQAYNQAGDVFTGTWTPVWQVSPGMGEPSPDPSQDGNLVVAGTSATFIAGSMPGTVTIAARYGTLSAAAQVVIIEKGPIEVAGSQSGVWYKHLSPYIVTGDIVVEKGKTLKIEPGVAVVFLQVDKKEYYSELDPEAYADDPNVQGIVRGINEYLDYLRKNGITLITDQGEETYKPWVFTVMGRLEAEGNDNDQEQIVFSAGQKGVGGGSVPYRGIWKYLHFARGSSGVLRHCKVLHSGLKTGSPQMGDLQLEPQVLIESGDVSMEKCKLCESAGIGIQIRGATGCVLRGNEISGLRKKGIVIEGSRDVLIEGNTISGVDTYGIESVAGVTGTITKNSIIGGSFPFCQDGRSFPVYSGNIIQEGKGIAISNGSIGLPEGGVLKDAGMPYYIHRVHVPAGCSLRIEKGVTCILGQHVYQSGDECRNSGKIEVNGRLYMDGVVFKPRGEGYWPWNSIIFSGQEASGSIINGCSFEGGGYVEANQYGIALDGYGNSKGRALAETGMIIIENSGPRIEGCIFNGSGGSNCGLLLKNPQEGLVIVNNRIEKMDRAGIVLMNCQGSPRIYNNIFSQNQAPFWQDANSNVRYGTNTYIENSNTAIVVGERCGQLPYGGNSAPLIENEVRVPLVTWYKQDLSYLLDTCFVVSHASTLIIEPGCVIKMVKNSTANAFEINGRLIAEGGVDAPIIFTSINDDEYYDDHKPEPKPGEGVGIRFLGTSSGVFKYCVVRYGDGIYLSSVNSPQIEYCTFTQNAADNILVENCSPIIKWNNISQGEGNGIRLCNASPRIEGNIIGENKIHGICTGDTYTVVGGDNVSLPTIVRNVITRNGGCPYVCGPAGRFIWDGNMVRDNGYDAIGIHGTGMNRVDRDTIWRKEDLPYLVMYHETIVDEGKSLSIEPGAVVKFMDQSWYHARLLVYGNLITEGTQDKPIVFTSMFDDSVGGKVVNIEGLRDRKPYPGSWGGIVFHAGKGTLTNCYIRYAGDGVRLENRDDNNRGYSMVVIRDSEIRHNSMAGVKNDIIYSYNNWSYYTSDERNELIMAECTLTGNGWEGISSPGRLSGTLSYNNIYNNERGGIYVGADGSRVNAINNWWGTATPTGQEIKLSSGVRIGYDPWLKEPWPNVGVFIDHLSIAPATFTLMQGAKWRFNVGVCDRDNYLLPSPGGLKWEADELMGYLIVNDTVAVFEAGTRAGVASITVGWGSLSATALVRLIEPDYGTLSGTLALRRDNEIWLMSADGAVLREVSRDKTSGYPKLSRCGRYLAYGKQGFNEDQRSLFMCDLKQGIERGKLYAYWYWEGYGPLSRTITGWTFAPDSIEPRLFLAEYHEGPYGVQYKYHYTKFDQDVIFCRYGSYQYPAIDNSGRIFGYSPDKVIQCWNGKENRVLVQSVTNKSYPVISPDGVWMACLQDGDIYITDTNDGLNHQRVTKTNRVGGPFAWLADGQGLVYPQQDNGQWDLWVITAGGKHAKNITNTPNIDEDQVDWSVTDITANMPVVSRIGIEEPEAAVVPNGSITLNACLYYQMPDYDGYPMEYRIIGGMDLGTATWGMEGAIGRLSGTSGGDHSGRSQVVFYGGEQYGEGTINLRWGTYSTQLRAAVVPSIAVHRVRARGDHRGGTYPLMEVWIDGKRIDRGEVGEEWMEYPVRYSLMPGTHTIDVCLVTNQNLHLDWLQTGSVTLCPTKETIYDHGQNGSSSTWFDGVDIVDDRTREQSGYGSMMWTGALRFSVYVEGTAGLKGAVALPQVSIGLSEKVYVFPNPWCSGGGQLTFVGLVVGARLQVYNIAGEKVFERVLEAGSVVDGNFLWKPENNDGQNLASGIYLYVVSYGDEMRIGKMGIVR